MNPQTFLAGNTREALRQVKAALGDTAVILSNRKVGDQVEIIATRQEVLTALGSGGATSPPKRNLTAPAPTAVGALGVAAMRSGRSGMGASSAESLPVDGPVVSELWQEMRTMQQNLLQEIAALKAQQSAPAPARQGRILRSLVKAGFSQGLAEQVLEHMPPQAGLDWVVRVLGNNLRMVPGDQEIVERGGVYALVGPTGVGKTTTTAKLAARAVVRYGAERVGLISTDSYRVGAFEQLRIYGKMLGIDVQTVRDGADLHNTLASMRQHHLILIDTMGVGQRDERVQEQGALLEQAGAKRLLLLNTTSNLHTLEDVVRIYRSTGVSACIPTKLDEAVSMGALVDVVIRHKLIMSYMANGQRVPEDLHEADRTWLLHATFNSLETAGHVAAEHLEWPQSPQVSHAL